MQRRFIWEICSAYNFSVNGFQFITTLRLASSHSPEKGNIFKHHFRSTPYILIANHKYVPFNSSSSSSSSPCFVESSLFAPVFPHFPPKSPKILLTCESKMHRDVIRMFCPSSGKFGETHFYFFGPDVPPPRLCHSSSPLEEEDFLYSLKRISIQQPMFTNENLQHEQHKSSDFSTNWIEMWISAEARLFPIFTLLLRSMLQWKSQFEADDVNLASIDCVQVRVHIE